MSFVISGHRITRNMLREASTQGRIGPLDFWDNRRLVAAMFLMLVVVFGLAVVAVANDQLCPGGTCVASSSR